MSDILIVLIMVLTAVIILALGSQPAKRREDDILDKIMQQVATDEWLEAQQAAMLSYYRAQIALAERDRRHQESVYGDCPPELMRPWHVTDSEVDGVSE